MSIGDKIKEKRLEAGLTLLDVAKHLGVAEATAQRYESGSIKNIKPSTFSKLASIFNCSPSYFMGWDDVEKELHKFEAFDKYLKSLGYEIEYEKSGESEEGRFEEHIDDLGNVIGKSWSADEEYFDTTISKNGTDVMLNHEQLVQFRADLQKSIEFELYRFKKHKNGPTDMDELIKEVIYEANIKTDEDLALFLTSLKEAIRIQ